MHYDFIEIGTCDFDTILGGYEYAEKKSPCDDSLVGLSIEPIHEYLLNLPNKPYVTKVTAAVSDYDGTACITYVPEEIRLKYGIEWEIKGSATIGDTHEFVFHAVRERAKQGITVTPKDLTITRIVPRISVNTLISTYLIESCDVLKIDTEGHDATILKAFVRAWDAGLMKKPKRIEFECHPLVVDRRVVDMTIELLEKFGFKLLQRGLVEVHMLRRDQWPANTMHCV